MAESNCYKLFANWILFVFVFWIICVGTFSWVTECYGLNGSLPYVPTKSGQMYRMKEIVWFQPLTASVNFFMCM